MELRFGAAICDLSNAQTIIAEGAAVIGFHGFQPFLAHPVRLMLSGGSSLPVFDRDTVMPAEAHKETTLFCTDNRDGEARLVMAEQARPEEMVRYLPGDFAYKVYKEMWRDPSILPRVMTAEQRIELDQYLRCVRCGKPCAGLCQL